MAADKYAFNNDGTAVNGGYPPANYASQAPAVAHRKFANPAPLGLFSFASTTLILSFYNIAARGVNVPNLIVGMALGVGGLCQLLAGMWEFACGNTFGATAFTSYGGFWISFALIYIPGTGILDAYKDATMIPQAVGFYLLAWWIFTFIMFLGTFRSSVALSSLFFFLMLTFMALMIAEFAGSVTAGKAGGCLGLVTAAIAFYTGAAGLFTKEVSYFQLPTADLSGNV